MMRFSMSAFSSLGKKIFMGFTGLLLCGFIVVHLIGNLTLLNPDKDPFNKYSHFLTQELGSIIYLAEFILGSIFVIHLVYAIAVTIGNWRARPRSYAVVKNAKHTSKKSFASTSMIYTGIVVIVFLVWHLLHFKFGEEVMYTTADGKVVRDLYVIVYQFYGNVINVALYIVIMALLGFHLSHGFWSAFQSLGLNGKRFTPFAYGFGSLFAFLMAIGFIILPVWIFFGTGGAL
ncbi:MAG: succinate dehydrogenase cytochrome b subunit [Calditrichales bacterium]|nr:MAG: succinate dehydrogenase cytochrome b subunit [Calditrichales bacterium]